MLSKKNHLFTSEAVTEGHPDKVCDQIADAVLDDLLAQDPYSKVACEVCVTTGLVLVMGEITTKGYTDIQKIVREKVDSIGYNRGKYGFDAENLAVLVSINEQSPDIAMGVQDGEGAGDQGIMFGYATSETPEYMPLPIVLAQKLAQRLALVRKNGQVAWLRPDGKTQVTVEYDENNLPVRLDTIVVSAQHDEKVSLDVIRQTIIDEVIMPTLPHNLIDDATKIMINPTGRFVIGGPKGDSGLTGRKLIVDTYGGYSRHGGGSFSGKDPTKVDRSANYMARYIAKNIVAAGLADEVEVQLAYVIGVSEPTSVNVNTFGTGKLSNLAIEQIIRTHFSLKPKDIIEHLQLRRPIYAQVAVYGHFGRSDLDLPWEKLDKVDELAKLL